MILEVMQCDWPATTAATILWGGVFDSWQYSRGIFTQPKASKHMKCVLLVLVSLCTGKRELWVKIEPVGLSVPGDGRLQDCFLV